jgi:hypothetical protein
MSEQLPPKDVPPAPAVDPTPLSEQDLKKVSGGVDPIPLPRRRRLFDPMPEAPADLPTPTPNTYERVFRR